MKSKKEEIERKQKVIRKVEKYSKFFNKIMFITGAVIFILSLLVIYSSWE